MKKILSLLSAISLSTITTTNIISCEKTNKNNKNKKPNHPKKPQFIPQQPPQNSNWKLIDKKDFIKENSKKNDKWYILIAKQMQSDNFSIIKFNFSNEFIWKIGEHSGNKINNRWYVYINSLYRWDGISEPIIPTINTKTGEIIDWNEKI